MKTLNPKWIRREGSNIVRCQACGGRKSLIAAMPIELQGCLGMGGDTTLMVWADLDHDMATGEQLKEEFWKAAQQAGITKEQFGQVVFVFAKDRIENWVEFLLTGVTDESKEGPRQKHDRPVADAAKKLANKCLAGAPDTQMPPSLHWSCKNWRNLVARMKG